MPVRIQDDFYSHNLTKYTVKIHDSNHIGGFVGMDFRSANIKHKSSLDRFEPIVPSTCDLVLSIPNSSTKAIITNMIGAPEGEFTLELLRSDELLFCGYILTDQVKFEDHPYPYDLRLTAVDGIARLKTIVYDDSGTPYSGKVTIFEHVFNCLDKIGLSDFWGASDDYLELIVNWWEDNQTYDNTKDPFQYCRLDHRTFIEIDDKGNIVPLNCYEVLTEICKAWGCKFMLSGGVYRLIQVNEYLSATNVAKRTFTKSQTGPTLTLDMGLGDWVSTKDEEVKVLAGGVFSYLPGLKHVQVEYKHYSTTNLLAGQTFDQDIGGAITVEDIDDNSGNSRIAFSGSITYSVDFDINLQSTPSYFMFRIQVKIDTYYLHRTAYFNSGTITYSSENGVWDASTGYFEVYVGAVEEGIQGNRNISFLTPPLPTDGDLNFNFYFSSAFNALGNAVPVVYTPTAELYNNYLEIYIDGTPSNQYDVSLHKAENTEIFTAVHEIETLMGDGPTGNAYGHLETTPDLVNWVYANNWRPGASGTYYAFTQLLARQILNGQALPDEYWTGTIDGVYFPHYVYVRNSNRYIYMGGQWNLSNDEFRGQWFNIGENLTVTDASIIQLSRPRPNAGTPVSSEGVTPTPDGSTPGIVAVSVTPSITQTTTASTEGDTITTIDIPATTEDGVFVDNQTIILTNPVTGQQDEFTVNGDVASGDTVINVDSQVSTADFPIGTYITPDPEEVAAGVNIANTGPTVEFFENQTGIEITLTKTIPTDVHNKLFAYRSGGKMRYTKHFTVDVGLNKLLFTEALENEDIEVLIY